MKLIPEWLPHKYCCVAWPCNKELYGEVLYDAKLELAKVINEISLDEKVLLFCNKSDITEARKIIDNKNIELVIANLDDSWMRDIAPIFLENNKKLESICFEFNGYGKYPNYKNDNRLGNLISQKLNIKSINSDIVLEGGAITYDEEGNLFTTESALLNKNRKNKLSKKEFENKLIELLGVKNIIWFPEGLVADDTDGHIDNLICPIGNKTYLIASSKDTTSPNYNILKKNIEVMNNSFKHDINLIEIPIPEHVLFHQKKLVASYINFYFTNNKIILPKFSVPQDEEVFDIFNSLFPKKTIIMISTKAINYGGGNIHCVTMNVPKI
mgnify:CR=1 FL=1|tara:strand:- start:76 stop:1053 length:978 start_codon:yes stop_codon:yes gene_type:complete